MTNVHRHVDHTVTHTRAISSEVHITLPEMLPLAHPPTSPQEEVSDGSSDAILVQTPCRST